MKSSRKAARTLDASVRAVLPDELDVISATKIATLWSSYGHIYRISLRVDDQAKVSKAAPSLILKLIRPPSFESASLSHARKVTSYAVERYFYEHLAPRLPASVPVASFYRTSSREALLLDDLSTQFPRPAQDNLGFGDAETVLKWLAGFHATFWSQRGSVPPPEAGRQTTSTEQVNGVWTHGTYFYLDTRLDEFASFSESDDYGFVKPWAAKVNEALAQARATGNCTLVHGDVKNENIVFAPTGTCALYDFQYVGAGVPTLDLIYFLGTSVRAQLLDASGELQLLRLYHDHLVDSGVKEYSWELLQWHWELAIVDWLRFQAGWGAWGNSSWVASRARAVVARWASEGFGMQ